MAIFPNDTPYSGKDYSSDGTTGFIPEIWSGKLQVKFYKTTVLSEITNNDWEGEIKGHGDKVIIRKTPDITVLDYKRGMTLATEIPNNTTIDLVIDKGKYFNVIVDDVNEVQSDLHLMDMFTSDAAEQMKIKIDEMVLAGVVTLADAANLGDTAGKISDSLNLGKTGAAVKIVNTVPTAGQSTPVDFILAMGLCLDEQNVPETGRWIVIPAWMGMMLKQSDLKAAYLTGDSVSPLRNGKIGMVDRFTVYVSNNLPTATDTGTKHYCLAGTRDAISFASQITKVETLRAQTTFGNLVRGLNVFGYEVTSPESLVVGYVNK